MGHENQGQVFALSGHENMICSVITLATIRLQYGLLLYCMDKVLIYVIPRVYDMLPETFFIFLGNLRSKDLSSLEPR